MGTSLTPLGLPSEGANLYKNAAFSHLFSLCRLLAMEQKHKLDFSFHASILALLILGPFQPFQNVLFNPSSAFSSHFKGLSSSPRLPPHFQMSVNNPGKTRLDIPELRNQQVLFGLL